VAAVRARQALRGQLLCGSLLVEQEEEGEEEQKAREMRQSLMAAARAAYDRAVRKEEEIIAQYPHGALVSRCIRVFTLGLQQIMLAAASCCSTSCG
jgi:hypothetical protein